ncbi:pentapeptide repeat-containing protein [Streptomyces sp. cg36]|uniref:pentapeptide repeat-containing protein n=1 Tax=Streptomyces sp. cg36 TaxID=3238798 RepID=UPI0034E28E3E
MTTPPGTPAFIPPSWPHCDDPAGCRGRRADPHAQCFAHLAAPERAAHLAGLAPGADLDHRGTTFTSEDLTDLLDAFRDPATSAPRLGLAEFSGSVFSGDAPFSGVMFAREAWFIDATFAREAWFDGATFTGDARFSGAKFTGRAWFDGAAFSRNIRFSEALFTHDAWFDDAVFARKVFFDGATFTRDVMFQGATFTGTASLGPLVCAGEVALSRVVFGTAVTIEAAAARVRCDRTRWESTATMRLRHAQLDLTGAVLTQPLAVSAHPVPFTSRAPVPTPLPEPGLPGPGTVRITSLGAVDTAHLVLTDVDLSGCLFADAFHLDQVRLRGRRLRFAEVPRGVRWRHGLPRHWTRRKTLLEEHHWRATAYPAPPGAPADQCWRPGRTPSDPDRTLGPGDLAVLYRDLRKAFEDGKNEPDAADFYYGECEMRRHDHDRPRAERALLAGYWALSGYGLRASRALGWLLTAMTSTVLAMMLWGLPTHDPEPVTTGTLPATGRPLRLTTQNPDPQLRGPYTRRFSADRTEKAVRVVVNSVVFRSSGQNLTPAGTYTEMASRFTEPVLLALAALAIRGRVKR